MSGDDVTIREARDEELEEVGRLTVAAYAEYAPAVPQEFWTPYEHELADAKVRAEMGKVFVAERDGSIVATGTVHWDHDEDETAYLKMLAVSPDARGAGIGEAFMAFVFEHASAIGARVLKWNTTSFMDPAKRLYARIGYEPEQEDPLGPDHTLYTYRVRL